MHFVHSRLASFSGRLGHGFSQGAQKFMKVSAQQAMQGTGGVAADHILQFLELRQQSRASFNNTPVIYRLHTSPLRLTGNQKRLYT